MLYYFLIEFISCDALIEQFFRDFILLPLYILVYGLGEFDLSFLFLLTTELIFYYRLCSKIDLSRDFWLDYLLSLFIKVGYKFPFFTTFWIFYFITYFPKVFFWGYRDNFWLNRLSIPFKTKSASIYIFSIVFLIIQRIDFFIYKIYIYFYDFWWK